MNLEQLRTGNCHILTINRRSAMNLQYKDEMAHKSQSKRRKKQTSKLMISMNGGATIALCTRLEWTLISACNAVANCFGSMYYVHNNIHAH